MKFKITKSQFDVLESFFNENKKGCTQIDLEPVMDTATEAIYEQSLKNRSFHLGFETGYKEGFHDGRCPERKAKFHVCNSFVRGGHVYGCICGECF